MISIWFRKSGKLFTKWEPKRCSISSFILAKTTQCAWDLVLFLVLVLVRMGLMKLPFMLLTEMVSWLNWSWLAKASLIAFSCIWANLFSYLETFARVGLMKLPFMLEMVDLELVAKGKLGNLLLHLGELVIILRDPLQDVLDELALCVTDGAGGGGG